MAATGASGSQRWRFGSPFRDALDQAPRWRAQVCVPGQEGRPIMPSLNTDRIRNTFFYAPNGDPGFTFTVIARASGLQIGVRAEDVPGDAPGNFGFVGPRDQGWASAVEHFGRYLAKLSEHDRKRRERQDEQREAGGN
jgi:hypothetical protein